MSVWCTGRVRWSRPLLTGDDSYATITRGCGPIGDVFHAIGEETGQVHHKYALRNCVVENGESKECWETVFQGQRDGVGGSLKTLWLRHSKRLPSLSKSVPFVGYKHSREHGVVR